MQVLSALFILFAIVSADKPVGSCGGDRPSKVSDCLNVDMGSCGNACCKVIVHVQEDPATAAKLLNSSLANGGPDGYYTKQPLAEGVTGFFDLSKLQAGLPIIGQVHHMTSGPAHYNDTIDFTISKSSTSESGSVIKAFSLSLIGGALGDNGQNYKNIVMALKSVAWQRTFAITHPDDSCSAVRDFRTPEECKPMTDSDPCFQKCHPGMGCTTDICNGLGKIGCDGAQCQLMGNSGSADAHCMSPLAGLLV